MRSVVQNISNQPKFALISNLFTRRRVYTEYNKSNNIMYIYGKN